MLEMTSEKCWNLKYVLLVFLETLITQNLRYHVLALFSSAIKKYRQKQQGTKE